MILCRYFDKYGLDTLQNLRLKVSSLKEFNDPFENCPYIEGDRLDPKTIKDYFADSNIIDRLYQSKNSRDAYGGKNKREFKRNLRALDPRRISERIGTTMVEQLRETLLSLA